MRSSAWLGYDPASGVGQFWAVEPGTERTLHQGQSRAHVQAILADNKRLRSENASEEHVATIPLGVMNDWLHEMLGEGIPLEVAMNPKAPDTQRFLKRKLNDSDWLYLRTSEGEF